MVRRIGDGIGRQGHLSHFARVGGEDLATEAPLLRQYCLLHSELAGESVQPGYYKAVCSSLFTGPGIRSNSTFLEGSRHALVSSHGECIHPGSVPELPHSSFLHASP